MSDRPTNEQPPQGTAAGGWRTPGQSTPGPEQAADPVDAVSPSDSEETRAETPASEPQPALMGAAAWRVSDKAALVTPDSAPRQAWKIPTIPRDLSAAPAENGDWHRPDQTTITDEDESVVLADEAPSGDAVPVESTDYAPIPLESLDDQAQGVLPIEDAPVDEIEVLPFDEVEETDAEADETEEDEDEADDEDRFSMSKLVALASLSEAAPVEAEEAGPEDEAALDPAEYARQQIEKLRAAGVAAPEAGEEAPVELSAEAQKFRDAEVRIRTLRDQYRTGEITRDELSAALKKEMVLDDDNSWWMMGVESDNWYHHVGGNWVQEVPPALLLASEAAPADFDATLPTQTLGEDMPLPLAVPTRDLDATIVGTEAVTLDPSLQPTMVGAAVDPYATIDAGLTIPSSGVGPTVVGAAVDGGYVAPVVPSVPSPMAPAVPAAPSYEDAVKAQQSSTLRRVAIIAAVVIGVLLLMGACGVIFLTTTYNSLVGPYQAAIAGLATYEPTRQTVNIYAADNTLIASMAGGGYSEAVDLPTVSPWFVHAVLSVEDPTFYTDYGTSVFGIAGGLLQNTVGGGVDVTYGITEQIACTLVVQNCARTPENDATVFAVSAELERTYSANFLLQLYINEIYLGNESYGVQAGGEFYFNTPSNNLNGAQSALLAGLINAPALYDPVVNRQAAFDRMNQVLQIQAQVGCLLFGYAPYDTSPVCVTEEMIQSGQMAIQKAQVEAANYFPRQSDDMYPHFVNYVMAQIEEYYGTSQAFSAGFQIRTTLQPTVQNAAMAALSAGIDNVASTGVNNGAVLVVQPTSGAITAMVGSADFNDPSIQGEVNNVFTWNVPGGAIYPVTYTSAMQGVNNTQTGAFQYMTAASILWNVPTTFPTNPPFTPVNAGNVYTGPTAVRFSLGNNYAVTAALAYDFIGAQNFVDTSNRMGINYLQDASFDMTASQGTNSVRLYDMVEAYSTLANNGMRVPLNAITSITDGSGQPVASPPLDPPSQQVQPQIAFLISNILADDTARAQTYGLNSALNLPAFAGRVAAKAGSSSNNSDLWTLGYSSTQVVGVWTGSTNNTGTSASVNQVAMPIWNSVMQTALAGTQPNFVMPSGIVQAQVCTLTGALYDPAVSQQCGSVRTELFSQNLPPLPADTGFVVTLSIDTWSGMQANQYCPDNTIQANYLNVTDPYAVQWLQSPPGQAFLAQNGITNIAGVTPPPACTVSTQNPVIAITSPTSGQTVQGTFNVTGTIQASNFQQYTISVASQATPSDFFIVSGPSAAPQVNSVLGSVNSTQLANGPYILRLQVYNTSGGYAFRDVPIQVNNPVPTALPATLPAQILPTAVFPTAIFTPLPFPTPIPFDEPTPTVILGP